MALENWRTNTAPCEGRGGEIAEERTFTEGDGGVVSMREAASSVTISLATNASRDRIALIIATGCYLPIEGEDPANA